MARMPRSERASPAGGSTSGSSAPAVSSRHASPGHRRDRFRRPDRRRGRARGRAYRAGPDPRSRPRPPASSADRPVDLVRRGRHLATRPARSPSRAWRSSCTRRRPTRIGATRRDHAPRQPGHRGGRPLGRSRRGHATRHRRQQRGRLPARIPTGRMPAWSASTRRDGTLRGRNGRDPYLQSKVLAEEVVDRHRAKGARGLVGPSLADPRPGRSRPGAVGAVIRAPARRSQRLSSMRKRLGGCPGRGGCGRPTGRPTAGRSRHPQRDVDAQLPHRSRPSSTV